MAQSFFRHSITTLNNYFRAICETFFSPGRNQFFFFFFHATKGSFIFQIIGGNPSPAGTSGKNNLIFGGKSMAQSFLYPSGGNRKGSICLACCGGKCITSPRATYTCHLVSAWLSLQMYSSKQEESLKKSHETYKVNKMAYDLFFVQYFMTYKKKPKAPRFSIWFSI